MVICMRVLHLGLFYSAESFWFQVFYCVGCWGEFREAQAFLEMTFNFTNEHVSKPCRFGC